VKYIDCDGGDFKGGKYNIKHKESEILTTIKRISSQGAHKGRTAPSDGYTNQGGQLEPPEPLPLFHPPFPKACVDERAEEKRLYVVKEKYFEQGRLHARQDETSR
jgi:hypothetical protein